MKFLLDTHVVLWCALRPDKLSQTAKEILLDTNTDKYVSIVSAWEFTVKHSLNKLHLDGGVYGFFKILDENGFLLFGMEREYVHQLARLPFIHYDPFDRMLIATAVVEDQCLMTVDENIMKYDVVHIW
jgi:PIN domain nuclease of toxin-antitoxin system